ncbi:spore coat protein [Bacillus sp. S3]|uniref:sugar phosphate nucleotidyltransferase n=1 Tax=Bacillus sp. S3 TaxID=486398 RepID=UPI00118CE993|nr:sugar phosphate nucleotidyltransferase [Bacillus sp. S3]QCJ45073.1 spore coat protein [Bacillus sp. S3]
MKGVILAGGKGTRLQPFTKVLNKHLLPVGLQPMVHWPITKLKQAGITEILIVTNQEDVADFQKIVGNGKELGVNLSYTIQSDNGGGIADALYCAKEFVEDKFVVLLGDNLFDDDLGSYIEEFKNGCHEAKVFLKEVPDPERYGVAILDENNHSILSIIEKPKISNSNYCVTGMYFYDKQVFELIHLLEPSARGEKEVTDLNNLYINRRALKYEKLTKWWLDAGTHEALFKANQHYYENLLKAENEHDRELK